MSSHTILSFNWGADYYAHSASSRLWRRYHDSVRKLVRVVDDVQWNFSQHPQRAINLYRELAERFRNRLAVFLSINTPQNILFTTGTFDGLLLLQAALAGEKVHYLTTNREIPETYQLLVTPDTKRRAVPSCTVVNIQLPEADYPKAIEEKVAETVRNLARRLPQNTILVVYFSWITYDHGILLPLPSLADVVKKEWVQIQCSRFDDYRKKVDNRDPLALPSSLSRIWVVADLSHVVGNVGITELLRIDQEGQRNCRSLDDTGIDVALGDAHKWLQGPSQSGFMWVRHRQDLLRIASKVPNAFAMSRALEEFFRLKLFSKSSVVLSNIVGAACALARFKVAMKHIEWGQRARKLAKFLNTFLREKEIGEYLVVAQSVLPSTKGQSADGLWERMSNIVSIVPTHPPGPSGETVYRRGTELLRSLRSFLEKDCKCAVAYFHREPWLSWLYDTPVTDELLFKGHNAPLKSRAVEGWENIFQRPFLRFCWSDALNDVSDLEELSTRLKRWTP